MATEVVPLSLSETVRQADAIVLGTAIDKKSYWGDPTRRWMATDYTFAVEDVLYADPKGEGIGKTVVLTFWGGTLDGETQTLSDLRLPIVGERRVVMLRPGWRGGGFTPVVGFNQGLFFVASEVPGGPARVRSDTGEALALTAQGQVVRLRDNAMKEGKASEVDLAAFTQWLRANVAWIKSKPSEVRLPANAADPRVLKPFSKTPEPVSPRTDAAFRNPAAARAPQVGAADTKLPASPVPSAPPTVSSGEAALMPQKFPTSHQAHAPIVVNQFPDSFASWSPEDQYQMSKWNYYASGVFQIYTTPTGTYGWGNGCFDLAGWPSSTDLQSQYGSTWETLGAGTIGVTFLRYDGGGWILEADIALNPAFSFTLDDEWVYNGSPAQGFRLVMHHELGHMLGLEHQFNFLSVMSDMPSVFRAFAMPYMYDAAGIRFEYSTKAGSVTDLGIYLYYSSGFQNVADATIPSSVASGGTLTVNNYHVENVGATTIATPTIEWYLTPVRNYSSAYYHIGDSTYPPLAPFTFFTPSSVQRSFTIPPNVPDGDYYLGAFIRDDSGTGQSSFPFNNNVAFSRQQIAVTSAAATTPANDDFANLISVSGSSGTTSGSNVGATKEVGEPNHSSAGGKSVWWQWTAPASGTAIINTAASNFDTLLAVYTGAAVNGLTLIASNDDSNSGAQSEVIIAVSAGTSYKIAVDGYSGASGSIQLNWSVVVGTPNNDNFVNRISVSGSSGTTNGSNVGATKETGEPNHFSAGGKSVWWQWTAPARGTAIISTDNSNFDTLLAVYTGVAVNSLTLIASDDDSGIDRQSQVMFTAIEGTSYKIAVDGYSGASGSIQLNWSFVAGIPDIRIEPLDLSFSGAAISPPLPIGPALPASTRLIGMTASPHNFREVQPDGTPIELNIRGGVKFHWLEDQAGYTVVQEGRKFVYARLDEAGRLAPTALLVGQTDPGTAGLRPRTLPRPEVLNQMRAERLAAAPVSAPPTAVPPVGTVKNVVILMRFANHTGRTLPSNGNFNTIFNAVGGDPTIAPTGSVRDLYTENSYGAMVLDSTVYGWVTLPQTEQYYANGNSGLDPTIHQAILSALNLVDPLINFSQFDTDGNGFVDSIAFVHSGYGAEWGGTDVDGVNYTSRIWSHRWQIPTWTSAEGVRVSDYHINPGLWSISGSAPGRIGVICHETGHFFGLPDLYDTDGGGEGIGSYCMMANSWGFTSTQLNPPHFSAWSKIFLGWMTPTLLNAPGNYSLLRAETSPTAFKISTGYPSGEYLLVENRQPYGFESTLPQGGLVIWHVDENKSDNTDEGYPGLAGWPGNNLHYKVALLQADGLFNLEHGNNRGDAGDVYHGAGIAEVSHSTLPNTDAYQNGTLLNTGNRIFAISGAGSTMTFSFSNDGGTSKGFQIFNDGTANLIVTAITSDVSAPWASWTPQTPFNVPAGESRAVNVSIDFSQAPVGQSSVRLQVYSDDPDESPFPGGVNILVNKAETPGALQFSAATYSEAENGGTAMITVTRVGGSNGAIGVSYATSDGTAISGSDYTTATGTLSWASGDTASKTFSVSILDDFIFEGSETVNLALSSPTGGATLGSPSGAILTILENDLPANDNFTNRIAVAGSNGTTSGSNLGATKETGEPNHVSAGGKSVWWQWTAPASGTAIINTDNSNFDTLLAVYTGAAVNSLTLIASDDDSGIGLQSQVTFSAIAGTNYEIAVDGYLGGSGSIQLNWSFVADTPDIRIEPLDLLFSAAANPPPLPIGPALPASPRLIGMTASPHNFREVQPDGTPIELNIRGGVKFHWLEDQAGYTVVQEGRKFVYARLDKAGRLAPTALLVGQTDPGTAGLRPRTLPRPEVLNQMRAERLAAAPVSAPPTAVPPVGTVKNVVILMRFANHTNRTLPSTDNFNTIFNSVGGDPTIAPTGSVRDFYSENSYGAMVLDSTVYGWVTLPQTEQYYANGTSGLDPTIHQAILSALNLVDPLINFSQFDIDGNGFVDSIAFVHSGYGAEWGGTDADGVNYTNRIWSHRWQIPTWTSAEGVQVSDYHINPGLWDTSGSAPGRIGVICHETGHFFGLPDLYDTDGGGQGIGSYCMMANSWGFTGTQLNPPHFSAWSKIFLGWMTPTLLNAPGNYSLLQAETSPTAFKISTGYPSGEYLLVENRQPYGFENTLPQGGLAIWHIDENKLENTDEGYPGQAGWPGNNLHYKVALLQADGLFNLEHGNNRGDAGDVYHGAGIAEVSHSTLPNTDAYQNGTLLNTANRIFAISGAGSTMTFSFSNAGGTNGFQIFNDGTANLTVTAIIPDASAPWVSWTPQTPFNVPAGEFRAVNVSIDFSQAPVGQSSVRLQVYSDDPDESPFPGGVNILVNKPPLITPVMLSYQGRVAVGGIPFTGAGQFKFALVNSDGSQTYWASAADTAPADGEPDTAISIAVTNGLYSLRLGDTPQMPALDPTMLDHPDVRLRIWFDDGSHGFQLLATDRPLGSLGRMGQVPFLLNYQSCVAVGGIPFTGAGQFKFALVNSDGSQTYWASAADTTPADGEPDTAISITVTNGLYSLRLGDTAQMLALDPTMLDHPDVRLRVWFNDGAHGFMMFSPDRRLGNLRLTGQVPFLLNYQGRVAVGGIAFTGTGQFKFALVNADRSQTYWMSAVDSTPADGEPDSAVSIAVSNGLYSLQLGDTAQMLAIDSTMLDHPDVRLRVWFNDGTHGFQLLAPDRPLGSLPF